MNKGFYTILFLAFALVVSACGKQDVPANSSGPQQVQEPSPSAEEQEGKETFRYVAPLTGMGTNVELPKRVVMVMINNAPPARPQSGLDKADIVYEVLAEGSITRFVGIYHSQEPQVIGPVRSIRPYYIDIGSGFDAVMVHAGGSPDALATLKGKAHMDEINNAGGFFWRESFRKAPHNLYTDLSKIRKGANSLGFRKEAEIPSLTFVDPDQQASGVPARTISVRYAKDYQIGYEYDENLKGYKRYTEDKPHKDLTTGEQLMATNLLVITSSHRILDIEGRRDVDVYGPGKGYLFQRGKAQQITWERRGGLIRAYAEGQEVPMYPGQTWVNITPKGSNIEDSIQFH